MLEEKAILTLSNELAKRNLVNIVYNNAIQLRLTESAKWCPVYNKGILEAIASSMGLSNYSGINELWEAIEGGQSSARETMIKQAKKLGANYLFIDYHTNSNQSSIEDSPKFYLRDFATITPVALIGKNEERILREIFYKNVPLHINEVFSTLEIRSFEELYQDYSKNSQNFVNQTISAKIEKDDVVETKCSNHRGIWRYEDLKWKCTDHFTIIKKSEFARSFLDFVFRMPEEDQNQESNNLILKELSEIMPPSEILLEVYERGDKKFSEYFEQVEEESKKNLAERIRNLGKEQQNKDLNVFLFGKGYDVYVEFLDLYRKDSDGFKRYFNNISSKEKGSVIDTIYSLPREEIRPDISKWLSDNYHDLVEDIGMNRVKEIKNNGT